MRRFSLFLLAGLFLLSACTPSEMKQGKKGSSGKTLEMLLVADKAVYSGDTKNLIDSLFRQPQKGLSSAEPIFDLVNIPISSFRNTEMFRVHRNVLLCEIADTNPDKVYKYIDRWSAPQVVFEIAASSHRALDSMIARYADNVISSMHKADYRRIAKAFGSTKGYELMDAIHKQFGFNLIVSNEFELAKPNNPSPDFAWIRKEAKDFGIGVLVHVFDYKDAAVFEKDNILDRLDIVMRHHVRGSSEGSYMATERRLDIYSYPIDFEGCRYAVETRGCWRTFGDFMGGPYVCYTLLSPDGTKVIMLTGYVYCPRFDKRDYLMQVDGICHSLSFDK